MQNFFNSLPNSVKIILGFFIAGLIVSGFINTENLPNFDTQESKLTEVRLEIETEDSRPIQNAKIRVNSQGAPSNIYSDSNGYARIEIPDRKDVEITIIKEGYTNRNEIINLTVDPNRNRKIKLEASESSSKLIDFQHYTVRNEIFPLALSLLNTDKKIPILKKILEEMRIGRNPLIVQNSVFKNVNSFKRESGNQRKIEKALEQNTPLRVSGIDRVGYTDDFYYQDSKAKKIAGEIEGESLSSKPGEDEDCFFSYAPVLSPLQVSSDNSRYTTFTGSEEASSNKYGFLTQFPKLSDLNKNVKEDYKCGKNFKALWIKKIIKNNPNVRGFLGFVYPFIFNIKQKAEGCTEYWQLERITPSPYVKITDITNNSKVPIRIDSITYQSINKNNYKLTDADRRSLLFQSSSDITENINISLQPETNLLIPIEFGFSTEPFKPNKNYYHQFDKSKIIESEKFYVRKALSESEWNSQLKAGYTNANKINMIPKKLSEEFVNGTGSLEDILNKIPNNFAVGSILNVKSVKINGKDININPPNDEPTVYMSTIVQAGSCPYLVVYNPEKDTWLELGTILYAVKDKSLQQEEVRNLGNTIAKVKIEEREPEITYIDSLSIIYDESKNSEPQEITYPMDKLKKVDGDYFPLHQGEHIEIDLKQLLPAGASNIKLKINGYYKVI